MYLCDEHADEVRAEYMLGEIGAFSLHLFGRTFYPIQVAEKGVCWVRATYEGEPGHGSMPDPDSAVAKLANAIRRLSKKRLPMHPTKVVTDFLHGLARELPSPQRHVLKRLTTPEVAGMILDVLVRDPGQQRSFGAMLSNTASPTIVKAGSKVNVIPGRASVDIDGRTLPGQSEAAFLEELRSALGGDPSFEVLRSLPAVEASSATPLYDHLAATLRRADPTGHPLPYLIPGFTDAKAYARLGTTCYGFAPVKFDPTHEVNFSKMYHGHDERVPVAGLGWGLRVLYDAVFGFTRRSV
jgi:acetylornithine deacetylase/succinyl-diaminopimelate desuccinylase-like protein